MAAALPFIMSIGSAIGTAATTAGTAIGTAASSAGTWLAANSAVLQGIGTAASAAGTIYSGAAAKRNSKFEAKQMKVRGDAEFAAGQRNAMRRRQERDLVNSRARVVAAASGGDVNDATVQAVMGKTDEEGTYNAMMDMYNGAQSRADLYQQSAVRRAEGRGAMRSALFKTGATIYGGMSDFYNKD